MPSVLIEGNITTDQGLGGVSNYKNRISMYGSTYELVDDTLRKLSTINTAHVLGNYTHYSEDGDYMLCSTTNSTVYALLKWNEAVRAYEDYRTVNIDNPAATGSGLYTLAVGIADDSGDIITGVCTFASAKGFMVLTWNGTSYDYELKTLSNPAVIQSLTNGYVGNFPPSPHCKYWVMPNLSSDYTIFNYDVEANTLTTVIGAFTALNVTASNRIYRISNSGKLLVGVLEVTNGTTNAFYTNKAVQFLNADLSVAASSARETVQVSAVDSLQIADDDSSFSYSNKGRRYESYNRGLIFLQAVSLTSVSLGASTYALRYAYQNGVISNAKIQSSMYIDNTSLVVTETISIGTQIQANIWEQEISSISPAGGYVKYDIDNTISWQVFSDLPSIWPGTQTQSTVEVLNGDGTVLWTIDTTTAQSVTLPANTLAQGNDYSLKITLNNGLIVSREVLLTTTDSISAAVAVSPKNVYVDFSDVVEFTWEHVIDTGTEPTGADIQYQAIGVGNTWEDALHYDGAEMFADMPAGTMPGGDILWRVRTYNADGVPGDWSDAVSTVGVGLPPTPVIVSVSNQSKPVISWTSVGQRAFQVIIEGGQVEQVNTHEVGSTLRSYKSEVYLEDGTYSAMVRVKNSTLQWSKWGSYLFTIATIKPDVGVCSAAAYEGYNVIQIVEAPESFYRAAVLRNGIPIGWIDPETPYIDRTAPGGVTSYVVRFISNNDSFADTSPMLVMGTLSTALIVAVDDPQTNVSLSRIPADAPEFTMTATVGGIAQHYAGRSLPVFSFSEFEDRESELQFFVTDVSQWNLVETLFRKRRTVLYRDCGGQSFYAIIQRLSYTKQNQIRQFSLMLLPVDFVEGITL